MVIAMTLAQALFVSDDILENILSLESLVCSMPTNYIKGKHKLLQAENISSQINKKLILLKKYLKRLSYSTLSYSDGYTAERLLQSIDELRIITEHLLHIAKVSKAISKLKSPLSFTAQRELDALLDRINVILRTLQDAFLKSNAITSKWMLRQDTVIQEQIKGVKKNHIERLRNGTCNIETGMCFLDLLNDYAQISTHCTALFHEEFIIDYLEERKG